MSNHDSGLIEDDFDAWSDDDLRAFIEEHTGEKPSAHIRRNELVKIVMSIPDPTEDE